MTTLRLRPVPSHDADGQPTWRVISGMGPKLKVHGNFASREEAVRFVLALNKIGLATTPGENDGSIHKPTQAKADQG